jgi:hypothetical protein
LDAANRVDDDASPIGERLDEIVRLELADDPDANATPLERRQPGDCGDRRAVVAAGNIAADEHRAARGHETASTAKSRKWAAQEMHGS